MSSGHGGRRVGAGRKPRGTNTVPFTGRRDDALRKVPDDLPEEQRAFWRTYAPLAIEAGTLTGQTVGSFRLLCELQAEKAATLAAISSDGRTCTHVKTTSNGYTHTELRAHPLTSSYARLAKQVEALFSRFALAPFGRPVPTAKPRAQQPNPWASIVKDRS